MKAILEWEESIAQSRLEENENTALGGEEGKTQRKISRRTTVTKKKIKADARGGRQSFRRKQGKGEDQKGRGGHKRGDGESYSLGVGGGKKSQGNRDCSQIERKRLM